MPLFYQGKIEIIRADGRFAGKFRRVAYAFQDEEMIFRSFFKTEADGVPYNFVHYNTKKRQAKNFGQLVLALLQRQRRLAAVVRLVLR